MTLVTARDGLPARRVHRWSDEKLFYLERYIDIFATGMKNNWRLVYLDLFSGPGICVNAPGQTESPGSPLLAMREPQFERLFFNDADPEAVAALRQRTRQDDRVRVTQLDCNDAIDSARSYLFPAETANTTLGLAFIDPTAYQISFDSIERLTQGIRVDLIITFMTGFARRFIGRAGFNEGSPFDQFMGTREWLSLEGRAGARRGFTRALLDMYEARLQSIGYAYADDSIRVINSKRSTVYHLVFASKHPRGADFFGKISERRFGGMRRLL